MSLELVELILPMLLSLLIIRIFRTLILQWLWKMVNVFMFMILS